MSIMMSFKSKHNQSFYIFAALNLTSIRQIVRIMDFEDTRDIIGKQNF